MLDWGLVRQILFKIIVRSTRHEYVIYDNGEAEGFPEGCIISNHYPNLLASDRCQRINEQTG